MAKVRGRNPGGSHRDEQGAGQQLPLHSWSYAVGVGRAPVARRHPVAPLALVRCLVITVVLCAALSSTLQWTPQTTTRDESVRTA